MDLDFLKAISEHDPIKDQVRSQGERTTMSDFPGLYFEEHYTGTVVIGLEEQHPVFQNKTIDSIQFLVPEEQICKKLIEKGRRICSIQSEFGQFVISSPFAGYLLDINRELLKNPNLLLKKANCEGYLFILNPTKKKTFSNNDFNLKKSKSEME